MTERDLKGGRVILTYGRSLMALVAAHSLGKKGVEVIGADSVDFTVLSFSRFVKDNFLYTDPLKDEAQFLDDLEAHIKRLKPDDGRPYVLIPVFHDTKLIARHKARFEPFIQVATPDFDAIDKVDPKHHLARTAQDLGVAIPKTWIPESTRELDALAGEMTFPLLIKPRDAAGGRGIHKATTKTELKSLFRSVTATFGAPPVLQQVIPGEDYCLTTLCEDGALKATMAYRNLHRFPAKTGAGAMRETVDSAQFRDIAQDLLGPLKWNGIAELDFLWDGKADSTPCLIEVNPRFWGGLFQSVESGIDFPWLLYELTVTGHVPAHRTAVIGTRTKLPLVWLVAAVQDIVLSEDRFRELEKDGQAALKKMETGDLWDGLLLYMDYLTEYWGEKLNLPKKARLFRKTLEQGKTAQDELFSEDDPYVTLGLLFILGSLIRHGHLPPEIKY